MKPKKWAVLAALAGIFCLSLAWAQTSLYVSSQGARLQADKSATSKVIETVPVGTRVQVLQDGDRWVRIRVPSGQEGWMFRGRLSDAAPQEEKGASGDNLFGSLTGGIRADEATTARSIRGLSPETEAYAEARGTPKAAREALDQVMAMGITPQELETFLQQGKIGEYAP